MTSGARTSATAAGKKKKSSPPPTAAAMKKPSKGRQKIEIKKVENAPHRHVTFSKRKNGLFKKATELSTLCGAQVAIILFSQHNKVFSCGRPDVDSVLHRLGQTSRSPNLTLNNAVNYNGNNGNFMSSESAQEQEYVKAVERLEEGKRTAAAMEGKQFPPPSAAEMWWETWTVDGMEEKEEVQSYKEALLGLKEKVLARLDGLAARGSAAESGIIIGGNEDDAEVNTDISFSISSLSS